MGLGIGCGVGWGPGFGPEVIGYVGAGCGAGFCVGITLAGIGIGLPANYVYTLPYNGTLIDFFDESHLYVSLVQCTTVPCGNALGLCSAKVFADMLGTID